MSLNQVKERLVLKTLDFKHIRTASELLGLV